MIGIRVPHVKPFHKMYTHGVDARQKSNANKIQVAMHWALTTPPSACDMTRDYL